MLLTSVKELALKISSYCQCIEKHQPTDSRQLSLPPRSNFRKDLGIHLLVCSKGESNRCIGLVGLRNLQRLTSWFYLRPQLLSVVVTPRPSRWYLVCRTVRRKRGSRDPSRHRKDAYCLWRWFEVQQTVVARSFPNKGVREREYMLSNRWW